MKLLDDLLKAHEAVIDPETSYREKATYKREFELLKAEIEILLKKANESQETRGMKRINGKLWSFD